MTISDRRELFAFIASDYSLKTLLELVRQRLGQDPAHDVEHCLRVALWTLRLAAGTVDERRAIAAALLHDIVNVEKSSSERARASELSAAEARRVLSELGFESDAIQEIAEAIRDHAFSAGRKPVSALGCALQDADRLEALGALGIFRTISTGARMGAQYFDPADPWADRRELDDRAYTVDHFFVKLFGLAATMTTEAGRHEARRRTELFWQFLGALASELGSSPPSFNKL
jgi:uncharacterized protein